MSGLEPLIIGALAGGGGLAGAGLLAVASLSASRDQEKLEIATLEANRENAKLASAEQALSNTRGFRRALANQLALANFRGGPGSSIASQFGSDSMSSFLQDQQSIERGARGIDTAATIARANASLGRSARDLGTVATFSSTAMGSMNLSSSTKTTTDGGGGG